MSNLNAILKAAKKTQGDKLSVVETAEKAMKKKRALERSREIKKVNKFNNMVDKLRKYNGLPLLLSSIHYERGGYKVFPTSRKIDIQGNINSYDNNCSVYLWPGLIGFCYDRYSKVYRFGSNLHPRLDLIKYEDLPHNNIWKNNPAEDIKIDFSSSEQAFKHLEEFILNNLDLEKIEETKKEKKQEPNLKVVKEPAKKCKPDLTLILNNPGIEIEVKKEGE